ncbi:hypothetical protein AMTRI_Chr10g2520 [Amborella trichopoda]
MNGEDMKIGNRWCWVFRMAVEWEMMAKLLVGKERPVAKSPGVFGGRQCVCGDWRLGHQSVYVDCWLGPQSLCVDEQLHRKWVSTTSDGVAHSVGEYHNSASKYVTHTTGTASKHWVQGRGSMMAKSRNKTRELNPSLQVKTS